MGKKYIIEIPEDKIADFVGSTHFLMPYMMAGHIGHHDTGLPITPYTEPDLEQVRKEAYDKGYHEGHNACFENAKDLMEEKKNEAYQRGLADAWEAARKIAKLDTDEQKRIYGGFGIYYIAHEFSAHEAIDKIRQYEQEQEEIKVGDEVDWNGDRYVVTYIDVDETYVDVIDRSCGSVCDRLAIKGITKTGRHFPEIAAVLEKMRGEQE